jgi:hypothetical protein
MGGVGHGHRGVVGRVLGVGRNHEAQSPQGTVDPIPRIARLAGEHVIVIVEEIVAVATAYREMDMRVGGAEVEAELRTL